MTTCCNIASLTITGSLPSVAPRKKIFNNIYDKAYIYQANLNLRYWSLLVQSFYALRASTFRSPAVPSIKALAKASGSLRSRCFLIRACAFFVAHTCQSFAWRDELQERQAVT